jgi:ketosteroid isomerase-like protein
MVSAPSNTRELLNKYYKALSSKGDWHSMLSPDIVLSGTIARETKGKEAFVSNNFFKMVKSLKVKQMIVEEENACAIVSYDLVSPKSKRFASEVAEVWMAQNGELVSLAIYFDTAAFQQSMS